jgi:hypothetical protein
MRFNKCIALLHRVNVIEQRIVVSLSYTEAKKYIGVLKFYEVIAYYLLKRCFPKTPATSWFSISYFKAMQLLLLEQPFRMKTKLTT